MHRKEGESPEGVGGMILEDSNSKVPCIGRGVYVFSGTVHKQE